MRHENKVNENKVLSYCAAWSYMCNNKKQNKTTTTTKKFFSIMLNLQIYYHFKLDFQNTHINVLGKLKLVKRLHCKLYDAVLIIF